MDYYLVQGQSERKIIEQCMRERLPLPDAIQNAPELLPGLDIYLTAFFDLNSSRQYGMTAGPIPWIVINEYCKVNELDPQQRDDMFYFIREMDNHYIKYLSKKNGS